MRALKFVYLTVTLVIGVKISVIASPVIINIKNHRVASDLQESHPLKITYTHSPAKYIPLLAFPVALGIAVVMIKNKNI
jgi:hypothetical protein